MPPPEQRRRFPDRAHEDLAVWVEELVGDQKDNRKDIGIHTSDLGDVLLLLDVVFELIDALSTRVGALEPPTPGGGSL